MSCSAKSEQTARVDMTTEALSLNRAVVFASAIIYWGGVWIQARRVRRRTGRSTNTRPRSTTERLLWAGWCFVVMAWLALPFLSRGTRSLPGISIIPAFVHPVCSALGMSLMVAGYAGTLWCYAAMGNAWRMGVNRAEKPNLVLRGPYRFVRHPIYLFQVVLVGAVGLLLPSPLAIAILIVHLICVNIKAADEEAYLRAVIGPAYDSVLRPHREVVATASQDGRILGGRGRSRAVKTYRAIHQMSRQLQPQPTSQTLAGKIALVTGGSRGIGKAIALKLASAGSDVAIVYHNSHEEAEAVCAAIRQLGRKAQAMQTDVSDPELVAETFATFRQQFDHLDLLVSNAAVGVLRPTLELSLKHWRRCMETNALALNLFAQQAVPLMSAGARIIAVSSLGALRAIPQYAFIGASKAALESLVRSLAQELGPRGIRVNVVSAGVVDTDALKYFPNREQLLAEFGRRAPAGPTLTAEAVADAVYLLCLPEAAMITGHTLVVDAGYSISG